MAQVYFLSSLHIKHPCDQQFLFILTKAGIKFEPYTFKSTFLAVVSFFFFSGLIAWARILRPLLNSRGEMIMLMFSIVQLNSFSDYCKSVLQRSYDYAWTLKEGKVGGVSLVCISLSSPFTYLGSLIFTLPSFASQTSYISFVVVVNYHFANEE